MEVYMKILFNILANILKVKIEDMRMGGNPAYESNMLLLNER